MDHKRYIIDYCSAPTGYGWRLETNSRKEARDMAREYGKVITTAISVWDNQVRDFIYDKRTLDYHPTVDLF